MELTQDKVQELFEYRDGALFWKHRTISRGRKLKKGGQKVTTVAPDGYLRVGFNSRQYLVHRVIFLYHHGYLPVQVDHIDGNRLNNCIKNLRPSTNAENARNQGKKSTNKTGFKGVFVNRQGKFVAQICLNYKRMHLGTFDTAENAYSKYCEKAKEFHKDFARLN